MSLASATARSIAPLWPDSTTWLGSLSLATVHTSPCGRGIGDLLRQRDVGAEQRGHRADADRDRRLHRLSAQLEQPRRVARSNAPAAHSALYSPRLCPATKSRRLRQRRRRPRASARRTPRSHCAMIAGCAFSVSVSSSSGPSRIRRNRFWPSASSTSSNTSRAHGLACGKRGAHADRLAALPRKKKCAHHTPLEVRRGG